jgi:hypothetical protein
MMGNVPDRLARLNLVLRSLHIAGNPRLFFCLMEAQGERLISR